MRHRYALLLLSVLAAVPLALLQATAQMSVDPLEFDYEYPRLGGELGLSSVWQTGIYNSGCGEFNKGARLNPLVAAAFDYPIVQKVLRVEALLGFQWRGLTSVYTSHESVVLHTPGDSTRTDVPVDFENKGTASISYIFLMPAIKFYPFRDFYVGGGFSAGVLSSAKTQYTKTILSRTVMIQGVGLSEVSYAADESSDPYSKVFPEEELQDASGFALDVVAMFGAEFRIGRSLKMGPRVMYTFPLSKVVENPELKLQGLQFMVGARYDLFSH